jgi:hypothetical protein
MPSVIGHLYALCTDAVTYRSARIRSLYVPADPLCTVDERTYHIRPSSSPGYNNIGKSQRIPIKEKIKEAFIACYFFQSKHIFNVDYKF